MRIREKHGRGNKKELNSVIKEEKNINTGWEKIS